MFTITPVDQDDHQLPLGVFSAWCAQLSRAELALDDLAAPQWPTAKTKTLDCVTAGAAHPADGVKNERVPG